MGLYKEEREYTEELRKAFGIEDQDSDEFHAAVENFILKMRSLPKEREVLEDE